MTSLYRKWRSQTFDDVIGQDHVTRTLRHAVRDGRVAHAYLFTGPRGTGKTSTARILARAVNCLHVQDGNPDNTCEHCLAAREGRALDVIEIDAASNTSVENVRDLRERVGYAAGEGQYKVYIVDEVHRLSGAAFDAFLKTLEEPPPHVIFVFASTEPHKVPATIASRCQRFDFRRISPVDTVSRVRQVATEEGIEVTDDALTLIGLNAGGSLRDALGLLDQVSAYATGAIEAETVRATLGLADPQLIARLTDALLEQRVGDGLEECARFVDAGGDPRELTAALVSYWRVLLLLVAGAKDVGAEIDPALAERAGGHAARLDQARVVGVLSALTSPDFSPKYNLIASLPFEVGFVSSALALAETRTSRARETLPSPIPINRPSASPAPSSPSRTPDRSPPETTSRTVPNTAPPVTVPPAGGPPVVSGAPGGIDDPDAAWTRVIAAMRAHSPSLQALLRSAFLLRAGEGELQIGFLYDWHRNQVADPKKRRVLEQVVEEVLGTPFRVNCILTTKEEVAAVRGAHEVEDDGFIDEAAERIRDYHIRHVTGGTS